MCRYIYLINLTFSILLFIIYGCGNKNTQQVSQQSGVKIDSLYKVSYNALSSDTSIAISAAKELLDLSTKVEDHTAKAKAFYLLAYINSSNSNFEKAVKYYFDLLNLSKEIQHKEFTFNALISLGKIYFINADFVGAKEIFNEALEIALEDNDQSKIANLKYRVGLCNKKIGNYYEAEDAYRVAIKKFQALGNLDWVAKTTLLIGNIHKEVEQYDSAIWYYKNALTMTRKVKITADALNNIGIIHELEGDEEAAMRNYKQALELNGIPNATKTLILNNLGDIYQQQDSLKAAILKHEKVITLINKNKFDRQLIKTHQFLFNLYQKTGDLENERIHADYLVQIALPLFDLKEKLHKIKGTEDQLNKNIEKAQLQKERIYYWLSLTFLAIGLTAIAYRLRKYFKKWKNIRAKYNHFITIYNDFLTEYRAAIARQLQLHMDQGTLPNKPMDIPWGENKWEKFYSKEDDEDFDGSNGNGKDKGDGDNGKSDNDDKNDDEKQP